MELTGRYRYFRKLEILRIDPPVPSLDVAHYTKTEVNMAVDVVEVCRRRFFAGTLDIKEIKIGTSIAA
jgi:hypothetical protein